MGEIKSNQNITYGLDSLKPHWHWIIALNLQKGSVSYTFGEGTTTSLANAIRVFGSNVD